MQRSNEDLIDLRHAVYTEVVSLLPPASVQQTDAFMANLRLPRKSLFKFLLLRVSPDIGEVFGFFKETSQNMLRRLDQIFGDDIDRIAGFYRDVRSNLCWNIPTGCALYPYRSHHGFFNGFLCQPLNKLDQFWLLSSSKFSGPKAIRLSNEDHAFFEAGIYKDHRRNTTQPINDLSFVNFIPNLTQRRLVDLRG